MSVEVDDDLISNDIAIQACFDLSNVNVTLFNYAVILCSLIVHF